MKKIAPLFLMIAITLPSFAFANYSKSCITILVSQIRQGADAVLSTKLNQVTRYRFRNLNGVGYEGTMPTHAIHYCHNSRYGQRNDLILDLSDFFGRDIVTLDIAYVETHDEQRTITMNKGVFWVEKGTDGYLQLRSKPLSFMVEHMSNDSFYHGKRCGHNSILLPAS